MKVRTFRDKTMAKALEQVKRQFGADAVILSTRTLTKGGLFGLGGAPYVEITAARNMSDLPAPLRRATLKARSGRGGRAEGAATLMAPTATSRVGQPPDALLSEMGALRSLVGELVIETRRSQTTNLPGELHDIYRKLVEGAVAEEIAGRLVDGVRRELTGEQIRDPSIVRDRLARAIEPMIPVAGPIRPLRESAPTVIALIGPTGVGKTTTIAKLAANLCLREHRRVGLITIDTYRIAAVDQLKTYAEIIDVPLEVVATPEDLEGSVMRMADREVILIDTAGRSQRDICKIEQLKEFFGAVKPDEVHLVLSCTCGESVLLDTVQRFSAVGVDRVIFTKLDEAIGFGVMLACLQKAKASLSYVTAGQDVPDDIQVGQSKALTGLVLGTRWQRAEEVGAVP